MAEVFGRSKKVEEEETSIRNEGNRYILQTLLYCWMAEANQEIKQVQEKYADTLIKAPNIYSVRQLHNDSKPTYVHHKEDEILYTEDIAQDFVEQLSGLLEEIYNPSIPFSPVQDQKKCEGCYLSEICLLPQKKEDA
jgi:CRISPR/Cas system-associated exonuclease Cas4 (RecB family)